MAYFPLYVDLDGKSCVVAGGGRVALRKVEKLLPFGADITVIAPEICPELEAVEGMTRIYRAITDDDVKGAFMVIAATDDNELNARLYSVCMRNGININTVDDKDKCSFIFPALVHRDNITVGITTSGSSPLFARYLRERTEELLSERELQTADILSRTRPLIKEIFSNEDSRREAAEAVLHLCREHDELPSDNEIFDLLKEMSSHEA